MSRHDLEEVAGRAAADAGAVVLEGATVRSEVRGQVGVITLDDERRRNALSARTANGIVAALGALRTDGVRAVVVRAAEGMDVWSAGQDIDELPRGGRDPITYNDPLERLLRSASHLPGSGARDGARLSVGWSVRPRAQLRRADRRRDGNVRDYPRNLGLPYNTAGLLHFLGRSANQPHPRNVLQRRALDAQRAKEWLVLNHLVSSAELESFALDLAATMASKSPLAIAVIKEQLRVLTDYQPIAAQVYERVQGLRREVYDSGDYREGLEAFAEKRTPVFRGT